MSKNLIIRADADPRIGTGHVMRCIALGQAWQDAGGAVIFSTCCRNAMILQRLHYEKFRVVELADSDEFLARLAAEFTPQSSNSWTVLDGYHLDLKYQQAVRRTGFKVLCVDDYNHLPEYEADILLNQNIGAEELEYHCNPECQQLLGTRYVMLRREFRKTFAKRVPSDVIRNILVTMGGSDPENATIQVIKALEELNTPSLYVKIIVGPSNQHIASLRQAVELARGRYELINSLGDMPSLIKWADLAISAAGSTCWELAALKVPFLTVILAENQQKLALTLERNASVLCAGWPGKGFSNRLSEHFSLLLANNAVRQQCRDGLDGLVDHFGVDRVLSRVAACNDLYAQRLTLRRALMADAEVLFNWANDPVTRKNSFNKEPIQWEGHISWLQNKIKGDNTVLFLLELDGVACGHIRYDLDDTGIALLSFVVAPNFRGMGLGTRLIKIGCLELRKIWKEVCVKAIVLIGNNASSRVLENAGFVRGSDEEIEGRQCHVYRLGKEYMTKDAVYIIAELSANHNGSLERAKESIRVIAECGADAVKLQTYTADTLTIDCDNEYFRIDGGTLWDGRTLYDLYKEAYTPWEWHAELQQIAHECGLDFFSTPFDETAVDFLEGLNVTLHKVAFFELVDVPLLQKIGSTQKPVIMSTGMATVEEIQEAVDALRSSGCPAVTLLKCTSAYPASPEDANLKTLQDLRTRYNCRVGLSDHTLGIAVPVAAVALGAQVIEKHFTLSRADGGADSGFSLEPDEFKAMVEAVRIAEQAIGEVRYGGSHGDEKSKVFRRSLFVVKDVKADNVFTKENVRSIRPGNGLPPKYLNEVIGKMAKIAVLRGCPLEWKHVVDGGTDLKCNK